MFAKSMRDVITSGARSGKRAQLTRLQCRIDHGIRVRGALVGKERISQPASGTVPDDYGSAAQPPTPCFTSDPRDFVLYHGDALDLLPRITDASVDLIFADPPYFLSNGGVTCQSGKMVSVDKGGWDRLETIAAMHEFNRAWLTACRAALKPNGVIWVSGTRHVIFSVGFAMQELGYKLLNEITWEKPNPPPNLSCRYFTHSTETILWAAREPKSKHKFNYQLMRTQAGDRQMKSVWQFTAPTGAEKQFGKAHPTQKPLALLERIILASSDAGDLVVDPFVGSGTTGIAAIRHGRRFIGIDTEAQFLDLAIKRYQASLLQQKEALK
jgi:site-specific DNA-methyltransferase (adenine-specific)